MSSTLGTSVETPQTVPLRVCAECSKADARYGCARCGKAFYCDKTCQRQGWRQHKSQCVQHCSRCEGVISETEQCLVPHPASMIESMGGEYCSEQSTSHFECRACGGKWSVVEKISNVGGEQIIGPEQIIGQKWCFQGAHSLNPLPTDDRRKNRSTEVNLVEGPELQKQINNLARDQPGTKKLTIKKNKWSTEKWYQLEACLPKLKMLVIEDVKFSKLVLSDKLTPDLETLHLSNNGDRGEFPVCVSGLKEIRIWYMEASLASINTMLAKATRLVTFDSYKLWIVGGPSIFRGGFDPRRDTPLRFASNDLKSLRLHRSDTLCGLEIWAPRLERLNLQACYDLDFVKVLADHPLRAALPDGTAFSRFTVRLVNASQEAIPMLLATGRVDGFDPDEQEW